jgi:hypothetical protein
MKRTFTLFYSLDASKRLSRCHAILNFPDNYRQAAVTTMIVHFPESFALALNGESRFPQSLLRTENSSSRTRFHPSTECCEKNDFYFFSCCVDFRRIINGKRLLAAVLELGSQFVAEKKKLKRKREARVLHSIPIWHSKSITRQKPSPIISLIESSVTRRRKSVRDVPQNPDDWDELNRVEDENYLLKDYLGWCGEGPDAALAVWIV